MFDIQDKASGQFLEIDDSERLSLTIASSLFETDKLSGAFAWEIKARLSPKNDLLFEFVANIDSPFSFVQKKEVIIWIEGAVLGPAVLTIKRTHNSNGYQCFFSLGISAYIESVLKTNLKRINFPNNGKCHILKELDDLRYNIKDNSSTDHQKIGLIFETSRTQGQKSFLINNNLTLYYSSGGGFDYYKQSELNAFADAINNQINAIYTDLGIAPEFEVNIYLGSGTMGLLDLDNVTMLTGYSFMLTVTGNSYDNIFEVSSPLRIDLLKFEWHGGTDFSGNKLTGGVFIGYRNFAYHLKKDASIVKEMKLMSDYSRTLEHDFPFVFAPINNEDFFKDKPASFAGEINSYDVDFTYLNGLGQTTYGKYQSNNVSSSTLYEKYLVSPQMRLLYLLRILDKTFPNTFNFSFFLNETSAPYYYYFLTVSLYNNFAINEREDANISGTEFVSFLQKEFDYSDTVPNRSIASFLIMLKNAFGLLLYFDFKTKKITLSPYSKTFDVSKAINISKLVSNVFEKEEKVYDSLFISYKVDQTDTVQTEFINLKEFILLGEIPRYGAGGAQIVDRLNLEFGLFFNNVHDYIKLNNIEYDEIADPQWYKKLIAKVTGYGYFLFDVTVSVDVLTDTYAWKALGAAPSEINVRSAQSFEVSTGMAQLTFKANTNPGYSILPYVKQRGSLRRSDGIFFPPNEDYNNDFEFRLFVFDFNYQWGDTSGHVRNVPFAKPIRYDDYNEFEDKEYTFNINLYDTNYRFLENLCINGQPFTISMKVDALFLQNFDLGNIYQIGSQLFIFKELRCNIPKNSKAKNKRYSAEADVYLIKNIS